MKRTKWRIILFDSNLTIPNEGMQSMECVELYGQRFVVSYISLEENVRQIGETEKEYFECPITGRRGMIDTKWHNQFQNDIEYDAPAIIPQNSTVYVIDKDSIIARFSALNSANLFDLGKSIKYAEMFVETLINNRRK